MTFTQSKTFENLKAAFAGESQANRRYTWMAQVGRGLSLASGEQAELVGLVVDEALRGRGIGAALVTAAEAWARERGLARLRVRSNVTREATHSFYRRLGYEEVKRQVVFRKSLGEPAPDMP